MGAASLTASAQAVDSHKFLDNWSLGIYGGVETPTTRGYFNHVRPVFGGELIKQITPVIGLGLQGTAGVNTTGSYTAIDNLTGMFIGTANLSNLFNGYKGTPRNFEVEAMVGVGLNFYFGESNRYAVADGNTFGSKLGLNFNFNLGKEKAWTLMLKPAIVYDLEGGEKLNKTQFNVNNSVLELTAGLRYHFMTSNGTHHFTHVRPYDQAEVDGLNAKVNDLRTQVGEKDGQITAKEASIRQLQQMLNDERNKKPIVETRTQTIVNTNHTLESVVTFRQGKSVVDAAQLPNVERIATYMKNHPKATVSVKGYASPEGSIEINTKLAKARAEAVKNILINKYRIAASRITAEGQGVGNMFSEPDWNRVSIATLEEDE